MFFWGWSILGGQRWHLCVDLCFIGTVSRWVCLERQTCNCAEVSSLTDGQPFTCCLPAAEKPGTDSRDFEKTSCGKWNTVALLLLTGGRPPTGQKPPWQAVYTSEEAEGARWTFWVTGNPELLWTERQPMVEGRPGRESSSGLACPQLPVPASGHGCRGQRQVNSLGYAQLAVNQLPSKLPQLYC